VQVGGLRVLGANGGGSRHGVFTGQVGLCNDFFANLPDMGQQWKKVVDEAEAFGGRNRQSAGTRNDLIFGSNSMLRACAEVYAGPDGKARFFADFVAAWTRVMKLDRDDHGVVE
jgi:catalase-peroxidase